MRPRLTLLATVVLATSLSASPEVRPPAAYPSAREAVKAYEKALRKNPRDATALMWLGMVRMGEGNTTQGVELLSRACEADSSLTEAFLILGRHWEDQGDFQRAWETYQAALRGNRVLGELVARTQALEERRRTAMARLDSCFALYSEGQADQALERLRTLWRELPGDHRVFELTARAALQTLPLVMGYDARKGLLEEAAEAASRAGGLGSASGAELLGQAQALLRQEEDDLAGARERVEAPPGAFSLEVCAHQRVPLLSIRNRRTQEITLELKFLQGAFQWVVTSDAVPLRAAPSREAPRIAVLSRGTPVWLVRRQEAFSRVLTPQGDGWVPTAQMDRTAFVTMTVRPGSTARVLLNPGVAQFRVGRGLTVLAEGRVEFGPYTCYEWQ